MVVAIVIFLFNGDLLPFVYDLLNVLGGEPFLKLVLNPGDPGPFLGLLPLGDESPPPIVLYSFGNLLGELVSSNKVIHLLLLKSNNQKSFSSLVTSYIPPNNII